MTNPGTLNIIEFRINAKLLPFFFIGLPPVKSHHFPAIRQATKITQ